MSTCSHGFRIASAFVWIFLVSPGLLLVESLVSQPKSAQAAVSDYDNLVPNFYYDQRCRNDVASSNGPVCQTDNATLSVWRQATVTDSEKQTIASVLNNEYGTTDLNVSYPSSPTKSGGAETDIIYQESKYRDNDGHVWGSGIIGETWCDDAVDDAYYKCDQAYVRFNINVVVKYELACHETGHAVGLLHGDDSYPYVSSNDGASLGCMETPDTENHPHLTGREKAQINATY